MLESRASVDGRENNTDYVENNSHSAHSEVSRMREEGRHNEIILGSLAQTEGDIECYYKEERKSFSKYG